MPIDDWLLWGGGHSHRSEKKVKRKLVEIERRTNEPTCSTEGAAWVVAALGVVRNLPRCTVEMQVSGDAAGLDSHQVTPNS